jgi:hypothetical protein
VDRAILRVHSVSTRGRLYVHSTGSNWTERGITMRNAPRMGRRIGSGRARRGGVKIDVTNAVSAGKQASLVLTTKAGVLRFRSRETDFGPRLELRLRPPATLLAAGDIADCGTAKDAETAALAEFPPDGTVAALGDLAYESGTPDEFNNCYHPTWGRFKDRTRPSPGNHEYATPGAAGYFAYWGAVAGNPGQGWYSYDLGGWHLVSLNSNCGPVGGCHAGSPQEAWLRADLAAHSNRCTAAYWHHPLFSGTPGTQSAGMRPLWQALYDANADLVLVGHAHNYQRFAAQNPLGAADSARGLREFVVGTGGRFLHPVGPTANLEVMNASTWGVLKLTLRPRSYDWQFLPIAGQSFTDSGSQACH